LVKINQPPASTTVDAGGFSIYGKLRILPFAVNIFLQQKFRQLKIVERD
jgi:hypothetical protein